MERTNVPSPVQPTSRSPPANQARLALELLANIVEPPDRHGALGLAAQLERTPALEVVADEGEARGALDGLDWGACMGERISARSQARWGGGGGRKGLTRNQE